MRIIVFSLFLLFLTPGFVMAECSSYALASTNASNLVITKLGAYHIDIPPEDYGLDLYVGYVFVDEGTASAGNVAGHAVGCVKYRAILRRAVYGLPAISNFTDQHYVAFNVVRESILKDLKTMVVLGSKAKFEISSKAAYPENSAIFLETRQFLRN